MSVLNLDQAYSGGKSVATAPPPSKPAAPGKQASSSSPAPATKSVLNLDQAYAQANKPPTNKAGIDVSSHPFNPLNPKNQLNAPQPSTSVAGNFLSSIFSKSTYSPANIKSTFVDTPQPSSPTPGKPAGMVFPIGAGLPQPPKPEEAAAIRQQGVQLQTLQTKITPKSSQAQIDNYNKQVADYNAKLTDYTTRAANNTRTAQATVTRASQPENIPQTPYNMDFGKSVADMIRAVPRAVAETGLGIAQDFGAGKNNPQSVEPLTLDPITRFIVGDAPLKPLATQVAESETNLQASGFGKASTPLAFTGVVAGTALNLLPLVAPFSSTVQGAVNRLATSSDTFILTPAEALEASKAPLPSTLSPTERAVAQRIQQVEKLAADNGRSITFEVPKNPDTAVGKAAKALGGENQATFKGKISGPGIEAPRATAPGGPAPGIAAPAVDLTASPSSVVPFAHEIPVNPAMEVTPFGGTTTAGPVAASAIPHPEPFSSPVPVAPAVVPHEANLQATFDNFKQSAVPSYQTPGPARTGTPQSLASSNIVDRAPVEFDHVGAIAHASQNVAAKDAAQSIINIINSVTPEEAKIPELQKVQAQLASTPSPESSVLSRAIDAFLGNTEPTPAPTHITLNAGINPGLDKFIAQDVVPKAKGAAARVKGMYKEVVGVLNPTGQVDSKALDIIMKAKGEYERQVFRTEQAQKSIRKGFDRMPVKDRMDFISRVEQGLPVDPAHQATADLMRERLDNAHAAISKYKDVNFLENFFPHFWEKTADGEAIRNSIVARRPLEGDKSFLKQRVFASIQEGMDKGYVPRSTNPEVLMEMYEQNVAKFVMAQTIKEELVAGGFWKFIRNDKNLPDGYAFIDDNIAKIYFPQGELKVPGGTIPHYAAVGKYAAPEPIARIINNHLSKDYIRDTNWGNILMQAKNNLNALQLGLSAFHVTAEALNSIMTGFDVSISQFLRGKFLSGAKSAITAPFNPIIYARDGQKFYKGDPGLIKIENDIFSGGMSLYSKNQYYKNRVFDNFLQNAREGNYVGAVLRAPLAAIDGTMRPIFGYYIPRIKIGAFRQLFMEELDRKSKDIASGKISREEVARSVWNNIENRFGAINYDNLFWNKNFKTAMMLTFRSVGWNLGTIRELGGVVPDTAKALRDLIKFSKGADGKWGYTGHAPDITPKMRYTMAIFFVVAAVSAVYMYAHTGKWPKTIKDFLYPQNGAKNQNGDPERVQLPTYLKDLYSYGTNALQTVGNKVSPELSMIIELIQNRDYFGDMVRNPHDNLPLQLKQIGQFLATQMLPFSVTNQQKLKQDNANKEQQAESFAGITRAPTGVIDSANTKAIKDALPARGARTPEEKAISNIKQALRTRIEHGENVPISEIIKSGAATDAKGAKKFIQQAKLTPSQRAYNAVPKKDRTGLVNPNAAKASSGTRGSSRTTRTTRSKR